MKNKTIARHVHHKHKNRAGRGRETTANRRRYNKMETQTREKETGKATLVVTYNSVNGFPAGTYEGENGPVIVCSNENAETWGRERAESELGSVLHGIYGRATPEDVEEVIMYVGLHARDGALRAAREMAGEGNNLSLVACGCSQDRKKDVARSIDAPITWSECGGRRTLGRIVESKIRKKN
jgi:hypothetical protein